MDWKVKLAWLTVACVVAALGAGALVGAKLWLEDARRNRGRPAEARGGGSGVLPSRAAPPRPTGPAAAGYASTRTRGEPHVLSLIVPVRQGAFLDGLKPDRLGPEDARALRGNCTWIWYDTQREYEQTKIAELLGASADRPADDVFDVRCVVLFLPAGDHRLSAKATALEQHQAFADLSKTGLAVRVSPPFPIELIRDLPFHRA